MSLWNPRRPLNQPPFYGRVAVRDTTTTNLAESAAKVAHKGAQFDRLAHTKKFGLRAKVV
ncbi:MAG: hypothetical protein KJ852_12050 [Gammaproteobacteria bacterium]|nr:hypothetical protein [Gammaproteobacteria bacterium]MBU1787682.1 hypothetical protein [Gammaproteobacteria bacterium]